MNSALLILVLVVVAALAFDYINGFHDAANAVATVVSTGVLPLRTAILVAALLNFEAVALQFGIFHAFIDVRPWAGARRASFGSNRCAGRLGQPSLGLPARTAIATWTTAGPTAPL